MAFNETTPLLQCENTEMSDHHSSMDIDDVFTSEPKNRSKDIADLLKWSYALCLRSHMSTVIQKYCHGCQYDHPSQIEHDVCLMMPFEEQVHRWFDEALDTVDEDIIIGSWFGSLGIIHPSVRYHEVSKYLNTDYRLIEWRDNAWKEEVKEKLISLEHHPH